MLLNTDVQKLMGRIRIEMGNNRVEMELWHGNSLQNLLKRNKWARSLRLLLNIAVFTFSGELGFQLGDLRFLEKS